MQGSGCIEGCVGGFVVLGVGCRGPQIITKIMLRRIEVV